MHVVSPSPLQPLATTRQLGPTVLTPARQVLQSVAAKPGPKDDSQARARNPSPEAPILEVGEPVKPSKPLERQAYRRKSVDDAELREQKAAARKQKEQQDAKVQRIAEQLKQAGSTTQYKPSVMLVDGYNIIFGVGHLKQLFTRNPEFGRGELEKWIELYAEAAGIRCLVVYDAMGGVSTKTKYEQVGPWLTRGFAAESEADTLIVDLAKEYQRRGHYKVVCVSGDRRIAMELADDEHTIIMLDAPMFMQHLQECEAGNVSGPTAWRSLWAVPRLSQHKPSLQSAAMRPVPSSSSGSGHKGGSTAVEGVQGPPDAVLENLGEELESILFRSKLEHEEQMRQLQSQPGSAYLLGLGETGLDARRPSGCDPAAVHAEDSDDDDDLDLNALLSKP